MSYYFHILLFIFGLIVGSFLNVVILRFDTGISIMKGRSVCFSCGKKLSWYELFPLLSFIFLRGKCRGCKTRISFQYPIVELISGFLFVLTYILVPNPVLSIFHAVVFVLVAMLLSLYLVICVYDFRHKVIPDVFSYAAALISLGLIGSEYFMSGELDPYRLIAGPILFLFFFLFWFVSTGTWMGLGDAKLALSVGWVLGLWQGIAAILFAFWVGAVISVGVIIFQRIKGGSRTLGLKSEIPFGPYILLGFLISLIFGINIQSILSFLAV